MPNPAAQVEQVVWTLLRGQVDELHRIVNVDEFADLMAVAPEGDRFALRFAGDAEMPGLVQRVLSGELTRSRQIKGAITDWQADWQRA